MFKLGLKWFLRTLLVILFVIALTLGSLFIPQTRVVIFEKLLSYTQKFVGLEYSGLDSPSFGELRFASLSISWLEKPWIECKDILLDVQLADLLEKKITINKLIAKQFIWHQPENGFSSTSTEKADKTPTIPSFWATNLKALNIDSLELDLSKSTIPKSVQQSTFSASGSALLFDSKDLARIDFQLVGLDNSLNATVQSIVNNDRKVNFLGNLSEAEGGVLGALIKFPQEQALGVEFKIELLEVESGFQIEVEQLSSKLNETNINLQSRLKIDKNLKSLEVENATLITSGPRTKSATLGSDEFRHTLSGKLDMATLDLNIKLDRFPLELLSPWVANLQGGQVDTTTRIYGKWRRPTIESSLNAEIAAVDLAPLKNIKINADFYFDWNEIRLAQLSLKDSDNGKTNLSTSGNWKLSEQQIDLQLQANEVGEKFIRYLRGYLPNIPEKWQVHKIDMLKATVRGSTANSFQAAKLQLSTQLTGSYMDRALTLKGNIKGSSEILSIDKLLIENEDTSIDISGILDRKGIQNNLQLKANRISIDVLREHEITLPAELEGYFNAEGNLQNSLSNPRVEFNVVSTLEYPLGSVGGGEYREPVQLVADGNWQRTQLKLNNLKLNWLRKNSDPVALLDAKADISFNDHKNTAISISTNSFPMSLLSDYGWPDKSGVLDFSLNVNSAISSQDNGNWLDNLTGDGKLKYLTQQKDRKSGDIINLELNIDLVNKDNPDTHKKWWLADIYMNRGEKSSKRLQVSTQQESLVRFFSEPTLLPLLKLNGEFDFTFFDFLITNNQHIGGLIQVDLNIGGAFLRPDIDGQLSLVDGSYTHDIYGLRLHEISAHAIFSGQKMQLSSLTSRDMGNGKLSSEGYVNWQAQHENGDVLLKLNAENFETLRHEQIEGKLDADVEVVGDFKKLLLKGDINITPFSASIAQNSGPSIPELNYVFIQEEQEESKHSIAFPELSVDLRVNVDKQAFIRGRGLEAELAGSIEIFGPVDAIEYKGEFKTVRGQFNVMGRRFVLERGEVGFSNNALALYVLGVNETQDLKVKAELEGLNNKFKLKLTSEPAMPEDELLAKLIFGRSIESITPLQALQLAQAIKTLQGGGGFDPVEKARSVLNVDTIKINTEETEEGQTASLGAGKYISDRVYLEMERSSDQANPWQGNLLIELTPHISLESKTGGATGGSAEILWKYDY